MTLAWPDQKLVRIERKAPLPTGCGAITEKLAPRSTRSSECSEFFRGHALRELPYFALTGSLSSRFRRSGRPVTPCVGRVPALKALFAKHSALVPIPPPCRVKTHPARAVHHLTPRLRREYQNLQDATSARHRGLAPHSAGLV